MSWSGAGGCADPSRADNRSAEHVAQSMQGLGIHSPQPGLDYCYSPAGHSAPAQLQHSGGYPPTSHSPLVQAYPRGQQQHQHQQPAQSARSRQQQLFAQTVQFSPGDGTYLPSPLESPSFRLEPTFGHQSPVTSVGATRSGPSSAVLSPYPSYEGDSSYGQQTPNDLYPFNSRPPDMSTSLSSAWSYPITTPPSSAASSFRQCVSRSTSPSAASVMSAYSSAASSASAPQGYHAIASSRAARSSPYHFRNRATSTPSLTTTGSAASATTVKVPTPRGGKMSSKVVIAGDRSAAQRNKAKLTDAQKKEICTIKLESPNMRQDDLAARFGVERSTVSKILKDTARWMNPAAWLPEKRKESAAATTVPITRFVELEGPLTVWLHAQASHGDRHPSDQTIKDKALEIAGSLGWPSEKFKASSGWLDGFKARHDLFKHSQSANQSSSEGAPSASTSRRSSPVKKTTSPLQQVTIAPPSSTDPPASSPSTASSTPTLKEGFEYTARKRSSSSVSLRANVPNLPTVLEDSNFIAQPLPRRAGQLGRSESLAMMASMENVTLAGGVSGGASVKSSRPGLSPLTPSSSAGPRSLPARSLSFPTGSSTGPATPASVEGSLKITAAAYASASPSEPPPPVGPFEARRHHQRLHSQSGLNSPSATFQPASFADNAWFSYPSPQDQAVFQQPQPYDPDHQRQVMVKSFQVPEQPHQRAEFVGGYPYDYHSPTIGGPDTPTFAFNDSNDLMLSAPPVSDYRRTPSISPGHSAVPSRLASPAGNSPGSQGPSGFPRTRSYTGSSLAMTSNYDAGSSPDYAHQQTVAHPSDAESAAYMPAYEPAVEQAEVCFAWGESY